MAQRPPLDAHLACPNCGFDLYRQLHDPVICPECGQANSRINLVHHHASRQARLSDRWIHSLPFAAGAIWGGIAVSGMIFKNPPALITAGAFPMVYGFATALLLRRGASDRNLEFQSVGVGIAVVVGLVEIFANGRTAGGVILILGPAAVAAISWIFVLLGAYIQCRLP